MMANLGYQFDYIWNQVKLKQLGTTVKGFLDWIIEVVRYTLSLGHTFWWQRLKGCRRRKRLLLAWLPTLSLASSSILWLRHSFAGITIYFFRIPTQTEDQQLSKNSPWSRHQMGIAETSTSWTGFLALPRGGSHCWLDHSLKATLITLTLNISAFTLSVLFF